METWIFFIGMAILGFTVGWQIPTGYPHVSVRRAISMWRDRRGDN